ncbi:hypothetical protein [Methylobacterium platani]|uniref:Uncharacterized protein n=2 Tax=Methylobacterium platani TaxID=427683 RepID=A0A179SF37_9HYPH|nr:hypothetical protein [Methylobacterium platani]KMO16854.1 hypothetical protein SQ03_13795 [Methylobacterium platani JCM 14648]OAS25572.1 hypothetical protein A5481_09490 [Methylobacterium platani]
MFNIGPFHRPTGQPTGDYAALLPLEPESLDRAAGPQREPSAAPAEPSMTRHALSMLVLLCLTLAVHSAVGWWTIPGRAPVLAPSAQSAPTIHVSSVRSPS